MLPSFEDPSRDEAIHAKDLQEEFFDNNLDDICQEKPLQVQLIVSGIDFVDLVHLLYYL